jgi:NADH dehydrogenase
MRVLVTGGTGVVGEAAVVSLLANGHEVRLFSRKAEQDVAQFPDGVEAVAGDIADAAQVSGAAAGCQAVVHIAGIVAESPPELTFDRVNVRGTINIVREAEHAGVNRFIYLSSLGAHDGESDYHRSKRKAEDVVRTFEGNWTILRPGNVYGPGDEVVSLLLKMVRTLPAIPVIDNGDQPFQPIWAGDLGKAIAVAVGRRDLATRILELAGSEQTTMSDILDRFAAITGKKPPRIPVPGFLATLGAKAAGMFGVDLPVDAGQITMLLEGNVLSDPARSALVDTLGITPTPLSEGLVILADAMPELTPKDGVGEMKRKQFFADIVGSPFTPEGLFELFRANFNELTPMHMPVGVEPGTTAAIEQGATLTMSLPARGTVQVRVEEITERGMTLCTVAGHALAGAVRFLAEQRGDAVRFQIEVYDRPASVVDWVMMHPVGDRVQSRTWEETVERVVVASGGLAVNGVEKRDTVLDPQKADEIEEWVEGLVADRKRAERQDAAMPSEETRIVS